MKGVDVVIEFDVARGVDAVSFWIKAMKGTLCGGVPHKDTWD